MTPPTPETHEATAAAPADAYQRLRSHLAYLKLAAAAEALPDVLDQAHHHDWSPTHTLEHLLGLEAGATRARRHAARLQLAGFPAPWRLADFDFDAQPKLDRRLVDDLATLRFIDDAANVLFIGPPGVGKTMLAVALGHAAVDAGHRAYYTTAADLAARCHRAALSGRWRTTMNFFAAPHSRRTSTTLSNHHRRPTPNPPGEFRRATLGNFGERHQRAMLRVGVMEHGPVALGDDGSVVGKPTASPPRATPSSWQH